MGKDYGGGAWEVATMGVQDLMRGNAYRGRRIPEWLWQDDELTDFTLGILAIG